MEASIVDLRYKMKDVLQAIERGEKVDILCRGKKKAVLVPVSEAKKRKKKLRVQDHPFFGMKADDTEPVEEVMNRLRGGRYRDV